MPRDNTFSNSYEELDSKEHVYDADISSFMANEGEAADNMYNDGNARDAGISNARGNVQAKMRAENSASATSAGAQSAKMDSYISKIKDVINEIDMDRYSNDDVYAQAKINTIISKAAQWNEKRKGYYRGTFMKHYNNYDNLATTYYILCRGNEAELNNIGEKKIKEFVDNISVDENIIKALINERAAANNPRIQDERVRQALKTARLKKEADGGNPAVEMNNVEEEQGYDYKYHKKITVKGRGEGGSLKRFKVNTANNALSKYTASRQYKNDKVSSHDKLSSDEDKEDLVEAAGGGAEVDKINAVADDKAANNAHLYSAETAKSYMSKSGNSGDYINGQFISTTANDENAEAKDKDIKKKEELRAAIRNSDFFAHVNSRTIQQYMTYDEGNMELYKGKMDIARGGADNALKTALIYLHDSFEAPGAAGTAQIDNDSITALNAEEKVKVTKYLLALGNNTNAWDFAKSMVENYIKGDALLRLKFLGNLKGEMLRMTLWDELNEKRKDGRGDVSSVRKDEYANMKGGSFLFSANKMKSLFYSGDLFKHINTLTGLGSAATDLGFSISKTAYGKDDATSLRMEKVNNWAKFGSDVSSLLNDTDGFTTAKGGVVLGAVVGATALSAKTRDKDYADILTGKGSALSSGAKLKGLYQIYKDVVKFMEMRKKRAALNEKLANNDELKGKFIDKNANGAGDQISLVLKILEGMLGLLSGCVEEYRLYATTDKYKHDTEEFSGLAKDLLSLIRTSIAIYRSKVKIDLDKSRIEGMDSAVNAIRSDNDLNTEFKKNKQAQFMLSLTKSNARRNIHKERSDMAANIFSGVSTLAGMTESVTGSDSNNIIGKLVKDIPGLKSIQSWSGIIRRGVGAVGKVTGVVKQIIDKRVRGNIQRDVVKDALGDKKYWEMSSFSEILNEETGIKSKHYLADLSKIFSAIDTHAMVRKPGIDGNELKMAKKLMSTYYNDIDGDDATVKAKLKKVKLDDMLKEVGFEGKWRVMLKNSISKKL